MAVERVPGSIHFRVDTEVQAALKELSVKLESSNLSEVLRTAIMLAQDRAAPVPEVVLRRARAEGILLGLEQIKKRVGLAVEELLRELRPGTPGREEAHGQEANPGAPSLHPDAG